MRVGVVTRGKYGERLIETIKERTDFEVVSIEIPQALPEFIEDPEEFLDGLGLDPEFFSSLSSPRALSMAALWRSPEV